MHDALRRRIEAKIRQRKTILEPLRGKQGRDAVDVAQPQDQRNDRLRRNGIKPGSR